MEKFFARCKYETIGDKDDCGIYGVIVDAENNCTSTELCNTIYHEMQGIFGDDIVIDILYIKRL